MKSRIKSLVTLGLVLVAMSMTGFNWQMSSPMEGQDIPKTATIACSGMVNSTNGIAFVIETFKGDLLDEYVQGGAGTSGYNSWSCAVPPPTGNWPIGELKVVLKPGNGDDEVSRVIDIVN